MDQLRGQDGRSSIARRAVLETLLSVAAQHITAEQLTDMVRHAYPDISESTVYRNLERFEAAGIAYHAHLGHGPAVWHLRERARRYLTCNRCGHTLDVDPEIFAPLEAELLHDLGFHADLGHFAITGTCSNCASTHRRRNRRPRAHPTGEIRQSD